MTAPLANALLEQVKRQAQAACRKTVYEDLTADEEFALFYVAGVPMRVEREGNKLRLVTTCPCVLTRRNDKWHVIMGKQALPANCPPRRRKG